MRKRSGDGSTGSPIQEMIDDFEMSDPVNLDAPVHYISKLWSYFEDNPAGRIALVVALEALSEREQVARKTWERRSFWRLCLAISRRENGDAGYADVPLEELLRETLLVE